MQFTNLLIVMLVAFLAPLVVRMIPGVRVPSPVLEIVAGIVLGPSVLGWVTIDQPVQVLSLIGLAFLLFLAGLEIDVRRLQGRPLTLALIGFVASLALAVAAGFALSAAGFTSAPLLVAIVLCATSLGLVVPVLKDAGEVASPTGQLVIAAASIADFGAVILLSLFFSEQATGIGVKLLLLIGLGVIAALIVMVLIRAGRAMVTDRALTMLQDTTAQIRIRFAVLLLVAFVALAQGLGFEAILGAFIAGALLRLVDPNAAMVHPHTELKLDAIGYGFLIPVFFVASGISFDASALFASASSLLQVPLFVLALMVVRGLPALLYRGQLGQRRSVAAVFLQATSLPFIVAATAIGVRIGALSPATAAGLVAAGLVSVLVFPAVALAVLRGGGGTVEPEPGHPGETGLAAARSGRGVTGRRPGGSVSTSAPDRGSEIAGRTP